MVSAEEEKEAVGREDAQMDGGSDGGGGDGGDRAVSCAFQNPCTPLVPPQTKRRSQIGGEAAVAAHPREYGL